YEEKLTWKTMPFGPPFCCLCYSLHLILLNLNLSFHHSSWNNHAYKCMLEPDTLELRMEGHVREGTFKRSVWHKTAEWQ
ncbi:hypothetical protein KI387_022491, partial [Taxus chinensis]